MYRTKRKKSPIVRATTVLGVHYNGKVALGADGQVSFDETIMKHNARKIRKLYNDSVLVGFAGGAADAMALVEHFEGKLEEFNGNLPRAAVELAKDWRSDRILRRLEALLAVMDTQHAFLLSGNGDVIEPDDGILAIGSGGPYAQAAAQAFIRAKTRLSVEKVVQQSLEIAAGICIYTNSNIKIETL
ncbi:MAG: ATP-dependent protease subunit HslV [Gemmatimonadetes bacterium]|nr:MAG: ATP-dependent protease subunit HslV [Gemmatimonadota bacterium]